VLNKNLTHGRTLSCRDNIDDGVEDFGVIEDVDGLAIERESGENLLNDEKRFSFHCGHGSVGNDIEGGIENGSRLLYEGNGEYGG
jgi:hypothetical protein